MNEKQFSTKHNCTRSLWGISMTTSTENRTIKPFNAGKKYLILSGWSWSTTFFSSALQKRYFCQCLVSAQSKAHHLYTMVAAGLQEQNVSLQFATFYTDYGCKTQLTGRWNAKTEKVPKAWESQLRTTFSFDSSVQNQFLTKQEPKSACVPLSSFTCRNQSSLEENTHPPSLRSQG